MCFVVPLCIISLVCVSRFVRCFFSTVVCVCVSFVNEWF